MKKFIVTFITSIIISLPTAAHAAENIFSKTLDVECGNGTRNVTAVFVDLKDPSFKIETVLANNKIKETGDLKSIARQAEEKDVMAIAAINGTFFNAYSDNQPQGALVIKGVPLTLTTTGSTVAFTENNEMMLDSAGLYLTGYINGDSNWPNNWSVWSINNLYSDMSNADMLFTEEYGETTGAHGKMSIIVEDGIVVEKKIGEARIPKNGFTIVFSTKEYSDKFKTGDAVSYKVDYHKLKVPAASGKGPLLNWNNVYSGLSAGPSLILNNNITANPINEGQPDPKLTTNSLNRSFIGVTDDKIMVMGTVSDVTISQLATVAKNLSLVNAMNLDGGASSGLVYKDEYLTTPGRPLSNAIVVTKSEKGPAEAAETKKPSEEPVIKVIANGKEIVFEDQQPIIENDSVLVPLRGVFENLGASVSWDAATKTAIILQDNRVLNVRMNSNILTIETRNSKGKVTDRREVEMRVMPKVLNGRVMVPLRVISENMDTYVAWNNATKTATLKQ